MKASVERKIIRWIHIIFSIPIVGMIYGPVSQIPDAVAAIQWLFFPVITLSGFWLWLGHLLRKRLRKTQLHRKLQDKV